MWPTATAGDAHSSGAHGYQTSTRNAGVTLTDAIERGVMWTTPQAHDTNPRGSGNRMNPNGGGACLGHDAMMWASPRTSDTNGAGPHGAGGVDLRTQVDSWPTPGANDYKGSAREGQRRGQLDEATEQHWQTPATDSFRSRGGDRKDEMGLDQQARVFPSSRPDQEPAPSGSASCESGPTSRPRLNSAFVCWLMGLPEGWINFERLGTEWSRWWPRMRSCLCSLVCGRNEP